MRTGIGPGHDEAVTREDDFARFWTLRDHWSREERLVAAVIVLGLLPLAWPIYALVGSGVTAIVLTSPLALVAIRCGAVALLGSDEFYD